MKIVTSMIALSALAACIPEDVSKESTMAPFGVMRADCSFIALDIFDPAPITAGGGIVYSIEQNTGGAEESPIPYSNLAAYSCEAGEGVWMGWDDGYSSEVLLQRLKNTDADYKKWKSMMISQSQIDGIEANDVRAGLQDQMECACELHYANSAGATQ